MLMFSSRSLLWVQLALHTEGTSQSMISSSQKAAAQNGDLNIKTTNSVLCLQVVTVSMVTLILKIR